MEQRKVYHNGINEWNVSYRTDVNESGGRGSGVGWNLNPLVMT